MTKQDINIYYVYTNMNIQALLCACKHHNLNFTKIGVRLEPGY